MQPNSIALTATGPDGINTGFGEIDFSVAMSAAVTGSAQTAVNWSVAGAGSISSAGVYTPPGGDAGQPGGDDPGGAGLESGHHRLVCADFGQSLTGGELSESDSPGPGR